MKLAIVFDDLIQFGGAERLLLGIHEIWPDAPVYTSVASPKWTALCREKGITLKTSFMQKFPFPEKLNKFYAPFMLYCLAFESFGFSEFDVVLSVSARFAHHIITKPATKHVCYMNSPGRMLWEPAVYFEKNSFSGFRKIALSFLRLPLSLLRLSDYTASQRVDYFIANSLVPQKRISKYYHRKSEIIYPFVDERILETGRSLGGTNGRQKKEEAGDYFLVVSRLVAWKKIEVAIQACVKKGFKLVIAGEGPDLERLKTYANGDVEFVGFISENEKIQLIRRCRAVIQTQYEDFGIVPLEAMALGKPVIGFGKGGILETVLEGVTGEFFFEQNPESLASVLESFDASRYSPEKCRERAGLFSPIKFRAKVKEFVNRVYLKG